MTRAFQPRRLWLPTAIDLSHRPPAPGMAAQRTLAVPGAQHAAGVPHWTAGTATANRACETKWTAAAAGVATSVACIFVLPALATWLAGMVQP